jgi:DNA repair protein RecO (recombination protein O)
MYHKHHTEGIVLWGRAEDADSLRVDIFTEKFGLLSARVQGARNLKSKLRAGCQHLSFGEFSLVHGKSGWRVVSTRPEKNFFESLGKDEYKFSVVASVINLLRKLIGGEERNENLFHSVINFFNFLERSEKASVPLAECLVLLRILHFLGYMDSDPELLVPISKTEIEFIDLETIAPRRAEIVKLINDSLKST